MDESGYVEVLQHLRATVRERRPDLDGLLLDTRVAGARGTPRRVLAYLEGLRDEMYSESEQAARRVLRGFRGFENDGGSPIDGVVIDVALEDVDVYGFESLELTGSPRRDQFIRDLDALIEDLRQDIDG